MDNLWFLYLEMVGKYPNMIWLVVYLPLWKIWTSTARIIPNIWKNKTCSKPPTSNDYSTFPDFQRACNSPWGLLSHFPFLGHVKPSQWYRVRRSSASEFPATIAGQFTGINFDQFLHQQRASDLLGTSVAPLRFERISRPGINLHGSLLGPCTIPRNPKKQAAGCFLYVALEK